MTEWETFLNSLCQLGNLYCRWMSHQNGQINYQSNRDHPEKGNSGNYLQSGYIPLSPTKNGSLFWEVLGSKQLPIEETCQLILSNLFSNFIIPCSRKHLRNENPILDLKPPKTGPNQSDKLVSGYSGEYPTWVWNKRSQIARSKDPAQQPSKLQPLFVPWRLKFWY